MESVTCEKERNHERKFSSPRKKVSTRESWPKEQTAILENSWNGWFPFLYTLEIVWEEFPVANLDDAIALMVFQ